MSTHVQAVAFDALGTVFQLESLRERLVQQGLPPHALELWYARLLQDAMALEISGIFRPFRELAAAALEVLATEYGLRDEVDLDEVLEGISELNAFPDVQPALELLRDLGLRTIVLTNGAERTTKALLDRNGLSHLVERVISIDTIGSWKPARQVYIHAANDLSLPPVSLALVSAHAWDLTGAAQAGLWTGWIQRRERAWLASADPPDVASTDLTDLVRAVVQLPHFPHPAPSLQPV